MDKKFKLITIHYYDKNKKKNSIQFEEEEIMLRFNWIKNNIHNGDCEFIEVTEIYY